jgi:AMP phosphorylase
MELRIKKVGFLTGRPVCMVHEKTAKKMSLHVGERLSIKNKRGKEIISVVDIVSGILKPSEIAVSDKIIKRLNLKSPEKVKVELSERPHSIILIKKKLKGEVLTKEEIEEIVQNIANNSLTEVEVAFFISAVYDEGMTVEETKHLINAMVKTGNRLQLRGKIVDKHSIGGVAGNRTTPLVISICSELGLIMPKTSSRAITSAAGTVDTIETLAKVDFSIKEIKKIVKKTNACLVWGGALGLAPADDKIIKIERIVNIDSKAQLLASILSKKISVGSKHVLIDIPYGRSAKVSKKQANELRARFLRLGKLFNLNIKVILTNGSEPIGNGIGPALEMEDILKVLKRSDPPKDLENKSIMLAGKLLEMVKKAKEGKGEELAREILESGRALKKFEQIIKAQGGRIKKLKRSDLFYHVTSKKKVKIKHINNKLINKLARFAGCPEDKKAGVYLYKKKGDVAERKDKILTIYAVSDEKLKHAIKFFKEHKDIIEYY